MGFKLKGYYVIIGVSLLIYIFGLQRCEKTVYEEDDILPQIVAGPAVITTDSTATISWVTDEPANGAVRYGEYSGVYDSLIADLDEYCLNHSSIITGLTPYASYYFIVESMDFFGNGPTISEEQSFFTEHNEHSYISIGWLAFEESNYDSAIVYFENARLINPNYADIFTGLGWCYTKVDSLVDALDEFSNAISIDELAVDAFVGRAAVNLKLGFSYLAIEDAGTTLKIDSLYIFSHDTTITYLDLHLILAEGYYQTQQYGLAHQEVEYLANIFELSFNLDENDSSTWTNPSNPEITYISYEETLLMWIQYLKDFV